jgi:hypothetical protein
MKVIAFATSFYRGNGKYVPGTGKHIVSEEGLAEAIIEIENIAGAAYLVRDMETGEHYSCENCQQEVTHPHKCGGLGYNF